MSTPSIGPVEARQREKRLRWTALILTLLVANIGCDPFQMVSYFMLPWADDKIEPQVQIAAKKKEVTVVMMASFASPLTAPLELQTVDRDLCDKLAQALKKRYEANKEKVKIVPYYKVKSFLNKDANSNLLPKQEIAKNFKADYLINMEINSMSFYEAGSNQTLFRGNAEIAITVFGTNQARDEGPMFDTIYRIEYPRSGPRDAGGSSVPEFRRLFLERLAKDLSRYFAASPAEERRDMD